MATVRIVDSDGVPPSGSSFVSSQLVLSAETANFALTGLKSHLIQNLMKNQCTLWHPSFPPSLPASNIHCIPYIGGHSVQYTVLNRNNEVI